MRDSSRTMPRRMASPSSLPERKNVSFPEPRSTRYMKDTRSVMTDLRPLPERGHDVTLRPKLGVVNRRGLPGLVARRSELARQPKPLALGASPQGVDTAV